MEMKGNFSSTACLIKKSLCRLHIWIFFFDVYIISKSTSIQHPDISGWSKEALTTAPDVADASFGDLQNKIFIVLCDGISRAQVDKVLRLSLRSIKIGDDESPLRHRGPVQTWRRHHRLMHLQK